MLPQLVFQDAILRKAAIATRGPYPPFPAACLCSRPPGLSAALFSVRQMSVPTYRILEQEADAMVCIFN